MFKKSISFVLAIVFLLAMVSQYKRTDGFLYLMKNVNAFSFDKNKDYQNFAVPTIPQNAKDKFLVIYEDTNIETMFLKNKIEKMITDHKKNVDFIESKSFTGIAQDYTAVLLAVANLDAIDINLLRNYAQNGGTVTLMYRPMMGNNLQALKSDLGIYNIGDDIETFGLKVLTDILVGGKGHQNKSIYVSNYQYIITLKNNVKVHITSSEDVPLLWENSYGNGKFVFYNGTYMSRKVYTGLMTAVLARSNDAYIYPVFGIKLFFIDDFPSPEPEGVFEKIYKEFGLTTAQFYRQVWWPEMLGYAQLYGAKYTGMIIENYNNNVQPPFEPLDDGKAKNNLITYGRELLKSGGELGIHGFNHQSLASEGYHLDKLGYNAWQSQENMLLSLLELNRYIKDAYPQYTIRSYVPPSNILSPEGREAVLKAFPDIKVFSSLYIYGGSYKNERPYIQDFERLDDGTYNIPRVSSGFVMTDNAWWSNISVINAQGIFSHFVHPDELYYENSTASTWKEMSKGFKYIMETLKEKYGWLQPVTASEATAFMDNYFDAQYSTVLKDNVLTVYCENLQATKTYYILRTDKKIKSFKGCSVKKIDDSAYLLIFVEPTATVEFEGGAAK